MKNILFRFFFFLIAFFFQFCAFGQSYRPNEKAQEKMVDVWLNSRGYMLFSDVRLLDDKEISSLFKTAKKCIELDSNYADPYAVLGMIKMAEADFISENGAFFFLSKYEEKMKKFKIVTRINGNIKSKKIECLIAAYENEPDFFNAKKSNSLGIKASQIEIYINECLSDLEYANLSSKEKNKLFCIKADFEISRGEFEEAEKTLNILKTFLFANCDLKWDECEVIKLAVQERLVSLYLLRGDNGSAISELISYLKFGWSYGPNRFNSIDFQEKRRALIQLVNLENHIKSRVSETIMLDGVEVFADDMNIRVDNYSSAVVFVETYNSNGMLDDVYKGMWPDSKQRDLGYTIQEVYDFYLRIGKSEGMVWPKYEDIRLRENVIKLDRQLLVRDLYNCDCINDSIRHIEIPMDSYDSPFIKVFVQSKRDTSLTAINYIPVKASSDFNLYLDFQVEFYNSLHQRIYKTVDGVVLKTNKSCEKLFELGRKQEENRVALEKAQQLQQEQEIKRLEQEQNYMRTQLLAIQEENRKKENEVELAREENRQAEQKKAIDLAKVEEESRRSNDNNSASFPKNEQSNYHCEWCMKSFSGDGYDYDRNSSNCHVFAQVAVPLLFITISAKYCSQKCAHQACQANH